jgi:hypothetical protein
MADFLSWFEGNWPNAITTLGVIGSLWIGIWTGQRELEKGKRESLERAAERHDKLWTQMSEQPSLHRILQEEVDLLAKPVTVEEEEFLNLVIVLFLTGWRNAKAGGIITLKELSGDVGSFFSRPLPHAVWEKTKLTRNPKFVRFIDRALERHGRLRVDC